VSLAANASTYVAALSGVIADFDVEGRRKTNKHVRIDVAAPDGAKYTVSTGLGVLDWGAQHESPAAAVGPHRRECCATLLMP
jgi:hypothetical protein